MPYWARYERTRTLPADGIKAKSRRGKFTASWWGDRWISALKPLMDSGRLNRGRSYARRGQVLNIDLRPGKISARVQGSRRSPYRVSIELRPLTDAQWARVLDALAEQALFAAQLLNEEMPDEIEEVFEAVKVPLFPTSRNDLTTNCSCPDWANPCKHIAAVYYLLGERFDEDPFLLFELRGRDKAALIAGLRERRAVGLPEPETTRYIPESITVDAPPLAECVEDYWRSRAPLEEIAIQIAEPDVELPLLKRAGLPDFAGPRNFRIQLERTGEAITAQALALAFAERE
ncbi:MAG: SWIM zinc finger family protein [Anaerolineales bacterium]